MCCAEVLDVLRAGCTGRPLRSRRPGTLAVFSSVQWPSSGNSPAGDDPKLSFGAGTSSRCFGAPKEACAPSSLRGSQARLVNGAGCPWRARRSPRLPVGLAPMPFRRCFGTDGGVRRHPIEHCPRLVSRSIRHRRCVPRRGRALRRSRARSGLRLRRRWSRDGRLPQGVRDGAGCRLVLGPKLQQDRRSLRPELPRTDTEVSKAAPGWIFWSMRISTAHHGRYANRGQGAPRGAAGRAGGVPRGRRRASTSLHVGIYEI